MNKKEFIPFLMAGDPNLEATESYVKVLIDEGVRTIELGVPFSDPLADGPSIQRASARALAQQTTLKSVFSLTARLRTQTPDLRIVLFTYLNPLLKFGLKAYTADAASHGVTATLCVDLAPEEAGSYLEAHRNAQLGTVFLASPTTSASRLKLISDASTEFIYYISRTGVTGENAQISSTLEPELARLRAITSRPIAVGFGISTPEQVREVAKLSDAVVVGSRLINLIEQSAQAEEGLRALTRSYIMAIKDANL